MAELTFKTYIRRELWPHWMIKLNEYLARIYSSPIPETSYEDCDRLKRIIFEKIIELRKNKLMMKTTNIFIYIVKNENMFGVVIERNNKKVITYYLE